MDTLHPDTNSWNSPPDLLLLVKPAQASPLPHIVSSRTNNVFLTKMDALLPVTNYEYSLPDLLLLVKAGTDITFIKNLIPP